MVICGFPFFFFLCPGLDLLGSRWPQNEAGSILSVSIFWNRLYRTGIISALKVQYNLPVGPSGPAAFLFRRLLIN